MNTDQNCDHELPPRLTDGTGAGTIVLVGHWRWDIYEDALAKGFRHAGWKVEPFRLRDDLPRSSTSKLQRKLRAGPDIRILNDRLLQYCVRIAPSVVLYHAADLVLPSTIKKIRDSLPSVMQVVYHNDNPFVGLKRRFIWRHFLRSIGLADVTLVYRPGNVWDALSWKARRVDILPPYYLTYRHRPVSESSDSAPLDVVFVGHYERDGRGELLRYLWDNGVALRVFGTRWESLGRRYRELNGGAVRVAMDLEYSRILSRAKMALALLSRRNRDVWTRRCFEIPACGALMLAPRTPELEAIFQDRREAIYYDSKEGLLDAIRYYLGHEGERAAIADAGRKRCFEGQHHEIGRAHQLIGILREASSGRGHGNDEPSCEPSPGQFHLLSKQPGRVVHGSS